MTGRSPQICLVVHRFERRRRLLSLLSNAGIRSNFASSASRLIDVDGASRAIVVIDLVDLDEAVDAVLARLNDAGIQGPFVYLGDGRRNQMTVLAGSVNPTDFIGFPEEAERLVEQISDMLNRGSSD